MNINDIPFNPRYTKEEFLLAKTWLVENQSRFAHTANFCIVTNGVVTDERIHQTCHKNITNPVHDSGRSLVATETGWRRHLHGSMRRTADDVRGWITWLVQVSPWARFIVNRDDLEFCLNYGLIVSADMPTPLMQNIMILSRHAYECGDHAFKKFDELIAKGVPGKIAYVLCFNTTWSHPWVPQIGSLVTSVSGHRAAHLFNMNAFKNFMEGELSTATECKFTEIENYRCNKNYMGGLKFFFKKEETRHSYGYDTGKYHFFHEALKSDEDFRSALSSYRHSSKETGVYKPPNPFTPRAVGVPAVLGPTDLTYDELWDFALPYCLEKGLFTRGK